MLHEIPFLGLLFSPLVVYIPLALGITYLIRIVLFHTGLYAKIWKPAWMLVSLFVCILSLSITLYGA
ncbi:DUF1656 domain-containing protein [Vibrio gazogenes]|uniref:Efflux system membrane protein n=1 Tax=Vibrio gazogenes DSM 21264 = NBRC 103151 TaxID=1123492 RepID=A0A1M4V8I4_VIBGA|nr:DUF1656 domain-containing protein [Vibrio gazogenes]USP15597.1 DUF1656 domain-containing protein [Vibrio gazogenes]SHE65301.1 Protein of unknown function [Vibrio gazogenes DSM 21264] [Vibrio gazogenes DSM 21264 = NBRC 103151]